MCHRRGDWSRTPSRASEPDEETEREESPGWVRAKDRLVELVSRDESEPDRETPERPAAEADAATLDEETTESEVESEPTERDEADDEREEEPIPADD
ncbi:hypothetical protein [Halorussus sp. AFM4]|uniref:hypothetical protein n=1 Tax=Halorussus sp. AFM4 TaxID=3421651 RepID=UPI003EC093EA